MLGRMPKIVEAVDEEIAARIVTVRGHRVLLDADLANVSLPTSVLSLKNRILQS